MAAAFMLLAAAALACALPAATASRVTLPVRAQRLAHVRAQPLLRRAATPRLAAAAEDVGTAAKATLLSILASSPKLSAISPASTQIMELSEAVLTLSSINPTDVPARSPLINGVWQLAWAQTPGAGLADSPTRPLALALYATGFSPGVVSQLLDKLPAGLAELERVTVTITSPEVGQPRVTTQTTATLLGTTQNIVARSNLSVRSDVCLREEFVEAEVVGQRALLPGPLAFARSLYVVYLDDELLVVRDEGGLVNVLKRVELFPTDSEPSSAVDDSAPGAG